MTGFVENHLSAKKASLILKDGSIFEGISFGATISVAGEVVFNTGMMGYPETFTDPSYKGQILCLTYPMIGNYGIPDEELLDNMKRNFESSSIHISGLIISDYSFDSSHWSSVQSLDNWLKKNGIPGIFDIDTRKLTKILRNHGTMLGKIRQADDDISFYDPNKDNLVESVSIKEPIVFEKGPLKVIIVDCGIKNNIIRCFLDRNITVIRVPWDYDFNNCPYSYDGIFISNGPGDPKICTKTIDNLRKAMTKNVPIFGICLGNQLLALAAGSDTYKLKFGHRSQNQPCIDRDTGRCYITSQNHGFAVDIKTLPKDWSPWFINANDDTCEGIKHKTKPFFSVQFHPEATPGPKDTEYLFDRFIDIIKKNKR